MEYVASILALVFFSIIFIYLFWGIHIIRLNPKNSINRVFLALCIVMSIWSFGFARAINALSIEDALFWRRVSAVGWTSVYATMLHFYILITHKKINVKKKFLIGTMYIWGFINMYIFAFSNSLVKGQYNLKKFDLGWFNISINNALDWFFYVYYIVCVVYSIVIVWKWKEQLEDKEKAKHESYMVLSLIVALVSGSLIDIILSSIFNIYLPQMGPIFILLPTWGIYYSMKHYSVIRGEDFNKDEIVVTDEEQEKVFKNLSIAFYIASVLSFISEYMPIMNEKDSLKFALFKSLTLLGLGLIIGLIQKIKNKSLKENLTIAVLVISIPTVLLQFVKYGGITVWIYPVIIMISSLVFSKRLLLFATTIVSIITQRLIWIFNPEVLVVVDRYDYVLRIGMYVVAFVIGFYVNKIYVEKIKENREQIAFQKINSELSLEIAHINQGNLDIKIHKLLSMIGLFFEVDRAYLMLIDNKDKTIRYTYEWRKDGIGEEKVRIEETSYSTFPWWTDQLVKNKFISIEDINTMPNEANVEQKELRSQEVKSLMSVPIASNDNLEGFIGIKSVFLYKKWSDENIKQLNIVSGLISYGLEKVKDEKKIEFMAYYDALTKLPNRFLFKDRADQAIDKAKKNGKWVAIVFIDLDNFKSVNDTMGHNGGDLLLKEIGNNLQEIVGKTDLVARYGGDEFMIMLNELENYEDIIKRANKFMNLFSKPFSVRGQDVFITSSAGISSYPTNGDDAEILTDSADAAMYKAKEKGKNQYVLFTNKLREEVKMNMMILNDLHRALERDELTVYYQPQLDLLTGKMNGLEALVRWIHPERGIISPGVFIPLAEKNGLISSIDQWVLKTACIQNKKWQDMNLPSLRMAVNLSPIQLIDTNLVDNVEKTLKESNLPAKYLELEITESSAIKDSIYIEKVLNDLRNLGVTIAIDDFGTEYSSLDRLKMLPIDRIKIDMRFTQGIETSEKDRAITMVIINLAKTLDLNVIAEGVETIGQANFLSEKLCDDVQGFYYHKPMPVEEIEKILIDMN